MFISPVAAVCRLSAVAILFACSTGFAQDKAVNTDPSQAEAAVPEAATDSLESVFPLAESPDAGRELVDKTFKLIAGLQRIQDLTSERIEADLDIKFLAKSDAHMPLPGSADYTWSQRLTGNWWMVGVNLEKNAEAGRPQLLLMFLNLKNRGAAMTPVCADLYKFAPAMVKTYGYAGRPIGTDAQHIRYLEYTRADQADTPVVELYPAPELPEAPQQGAACLKSIVIR